jgi:hypothetical protein
MPGDRPVLIHAEAQARLARIVTRLRADPVDGPLVGEFRDLAPEPGSADRREVGEECGVHNAQRRVPWHGHGDDRDKFGGVSPVDRGGAVAKSSRSDSTP